MPLPASGPSSTPLWVLCHGTPLTPSVWDRVANVLSTTGRVSQPALAPSPGGPAMVSGLARALLDGLPAGAKVHLVGHSFGGQVALEAALTGDRRITSLTMVCSRDTPFPPFSASARAMLAGTPIDVDAVVRRWFRPDELDRSDELVEYARACVREADPRWWAACLESIATFDRHAAAATLEVPVHLIAAELDQVSPAAAMGAMAKRIPRARLTVLADVAHVSLFAQPTILASLIASSATTLGAQREHSR